MELLYLVLLIAIIVVFFVLVRRPMYECVLFAFLIVAAISGHITDIPRYLVAGGSSYLLYTLTAFMALSIVIEKTGIITDFINVIIAFVGRFSGGAGYVALLASAAFGALSGTGPGNAAATGVVAIPAMKKTGFSAELAASVESAASSLGPVIPPSGTVIAIYGFLEVLYPGCCTFSEFWLIMWGVSIIFIIQRLLLLFVLIKKEHISPIPKEERLPVSVALKRGWKAVLLPVIVFIPFLFDGLFNSTLITERVGSEVADSFTSILLVLIPSIAIAYVLLLQWIEGKRIGFTRLSEMFFDSIPSIAPVTFLVICGFAIGELFTDIDLGGAIEMMTENMNLSLWAVVIILPLVLTLLGMFLEVMTICLLVTTPCLLIGAAVGINPILLAAMISIMAVAMGHMTPPFALTFYVSMGIAESDFIGTTKYAVIWCVAQYIVTIPVLLGWIPVPGMIPFSP